MGPQVHILQNIWTPGTNFAAKSVPCHNLCSPVDGSLSYDPIYIYVYRMNFAQTFRTPQEVASVLQQERTAAVQHTYE